MALPLRLLKTEYFVLWLSLLYVLSMGPFTEGFFTLANLSAVTIALLPLFVVAMGQTIVLVTGGIDLSVTSTMALCSVAGASIMSGDAGLLKHHPAAVPVAIVAMLAVGACVGAANGLAVTRLKMPPFIVTLTTMMFVSGFAVWATRSQNIGNLPAHFNAIGGNVWICLLVVLALGVFAHVLLSRTLLGVWTQMTGHNARAAYISGVPVNAVICSAYIMSGAMAAASSILYTGQAESGSPILGQKMLLDVVGATVIGGTSLFGGKGKIAWTLFGVIFIKLIDNTLNLLDLSHFTIMVVKGGVILLAAGLDTLRSRTTS